MAEKDITEKLLEEYNDVFADIVNVLLFGGEEVIKPDELGRAGTESHYKADDSKLHEQERDVAKYWEKGGIKIALCGLENQTNIHNDMPMRIINYDGVSYRSQLLAESQRYPVMTLVLYFGYTKRWDGPVTLYEMFDIPENMKTYVNDYKINLFEIAYLSDEQVKMFKSDFRIVADYFVQMRKNNDYIPDPIEFRHVDEVLKFMEVFAKDKRYTEAFQETGTGGVHNMCEVLERIEQRGIKQGIKQGIEQGIERGEEKAKITVFKNMILRGFSSEEAQAISEITDRQVEIALAEIKK